MSAIETRSVAVGTAPDGADRTSPAPEEARGIPLAGEPSVSSPSQDDAEGNAVSPLAPGGDVAVEEVDGDTSPPPSQWMPPPDGDDVSMLGGGDRFDFAIDPDRGRELVGDGGHFIRFFDHTGGGEKRWSVHLPDGEAVAVMRGRSAAEAAVHQLIETGRITR
jgi:hypothetical protein